MDIGLGLTVHLKPEEAKRVLPKIISNLEKKISRREDEVIEIERLRNNFLKQLELYESVQEGMVNVGGI